MFCATAPGLSVACSSSRTIAVGVEPGMRTVVPFDLQRRQALLRRSHVIGDDRDGVVEPHDLAHTLDGLGRRIVHALQAAAEHGRLRQRCDLHAGRTSVDAIDRRAVDLRRGVEPLGRRADQLEVFGLLERDVRRDRHARSVGGKLAIFDASSGRRVQHLAALRAAGCGIDVPALGRGRHQHGARGRAGLAQRLPRAAHRI